LMPKMRRARRIPRSRAGQSTARERRGCRHRLDPGSGLRQPWPAIITPMNALPILATQAAPDEPLAVIEAMILDLRRLRDREPGKEVRTAYQVTIDRLHSLIDRLNQPRPRTIALPAAPASAPSPAATPGPRDERHRAGGEHQVRQPPEKRLLPAQRLRAAASRRPLHKSGEQRDRESGPKDIPPTPVGSSRLRVRRRTRPVPTQRGQSANSRINPPVYLNPQCQVDGGDERHASRKLLPTSALNWSSALVYRKSSRRLTAFDGSKKSNRVPVILVMNNVSIAHADHRDVALVVSLFRKKALPTTVTAHLGSADLVRGSAEG